ncbi:Alpha-L-fucosidase [Beutenbergia cavernae DSM 12333]|uniref:alpha-L-fucosidase n=1 Tax=Beutenbergia cavernae (strain ATCC BAA-8 / DSM 12333 / CCUG 43141 / JCM 11478 / NBRC 16432 / NCIMB 13614 / HKI 0122) TaxID=471853 RepID=C5C2T8_BEUC1|nr:alpha-L-fucosidase [Beutenbergia cavernae]ACQ81782.1 Alpha-L-fucosidase [Beutenbergia cavernae DSM 12333]
MTQHAPESNVAGPATFAPTPPGQVSEKGLAWYRDAGFGMFVHWGVYSLLGRGEWVMFNERIGVAEYEPLAARFEAQDFDARAWVDAAQSAGQKYITVTSRHHDGFSMYDTALSDYKVTRSPMGRDPFAELAEAVQGTDVKLGVYSSLVDWHHPAYRFRETSKLAWEDYVGFLHGQIAELASQYGEIAQFWFDGDWPHAGHASEDADWFAPGGSFAYETLYGVIHRLQPDAVVLNNRHVLPLLPGEDVQGFEQDLPGENTAGFNDVAIGGGPLETCLTMNGSWGWNTGDHDYKSAEELASALERANAVGCNLLLNVGPTPEGRIPEPQVERLAAIGALRQG